MTTAKYSVSIDSIVVDTAVGDSNAINYSDFESGMVHIPDGSSLTSLTWYVSSSENGTYLPARNTIEMGSGPTSHVVSDGNAYPIPNNLRGARFLKIVGDAAGVVGVTLKD